MRVRTPCFQCQDRHPGCHSKCEAYLQWKRDIGSFTEDVRKAKAHEHPPKTESDERRWRKTLKERSRK